MCALDSRCQFDPAQRAMFFQKWTYVDGAWSWRLYNSERHGAVGANLVKLLCKMHHEELQALWDKEIRENIEEEEATDEYLRKRTARAPIGRGRYRLSAPSERSAPR